MNEVEPRRPLLLLLDDETAFSALITRALDHEFEIEVASTVEEAMLLLGAHRFDVLLCDHMLPGGRQGLDFLVDAMRLQPAAKRILMTGYMNPELIARSKSLAGLSDVLLKPLSAQEIRTALNVTLGLGA